MSKVAIEGNASGSGTFTIASPNSNTNRTLTLPDSTGTVVVSGTTPSLNGITFPATQVASAGANTLDDYEEGTWTPVLAGREGSVSGQAYEEQTGKYTKIGNVVYWSCFVQLTTEGTPGTGQSGIRGLPFTVVSGSNAPGCFYVGRFANLQSNVVFITGAYVGNETNAVFRTLTTAATSVVIPDPPADFFTNTTLIQASGFYYIS